jgi:hypothetical protein
MNSRFPLTGPMPVAQRSGNGFVPVIIFAPGYGPEERYPRKAKANPDDAILHASSVIWWRQRRQAEKRRKLEALSNPVTWGELAAAPEAQQQAYWAGLLNHWRRNAEAERDADVRFDYSRERRQMWEAGQ